MNIFLNTRSTGIIKRTGGDKKQDLNILKQSGPSVEKID